MAAPTIKMAADEPKERTEAKVLMRLQRQAEMITAISEGLRALFSH